MHVSTSGECASPSDFNHEVYPFRVAPDGWKGEFMILQFVGRGLWNIFRTAVWLLLTVLRCAMEFGKLMLLMFGLVTKIFLVFARVAVD